MRNGLIAFALGGLMSPVLFGSGPVEVKLTPEVREYCHIVRFPLGWKIQDYDPVIHQFLSFDYYSKYEFRVQRHVDTTFLVGGLVYPSEIYAINKYKIDLSDPAGVAHAAMEEDWQGAMIVPDTGAEDFWKYVVPFGLPHPFKDDTALPFHGFNFVKSGTHWSGPGLLSHDQSWLVLLSWSGKTAKRGSDIFDLILSGRDKGRLYFDVCDANTGKKVITIVASYLDIDPGSAVSKCRWVTERYFIVPLGEHRERCLVCDFGHAGQNEGAGR